VELSAKPFPGTQGNANAPHPGHADAHLRSAQAVNGYNLKAGGEVVGHVCDFMMDPQNWAVVQLAVKTGHRISGKEVLIPTNKLDRISYKESTVFANLTREAVEQMAANHLVSAGAVA